MIKEKSFSTCIVPIRDGKVALLQYHKEWYGAIGGRVEDGETIYQGLRRELSEELGPEAVMLADNAIEIKEPYCFDHTRFRTR